MNADERKTLLFSSLEIVFLTCCITAYFSINQLSLCCVDNSVLSEDLCSIISFKMPGFWLFLLLDLFLLLANATWQRPVRALPKCYINVMLCKLSLIQIIHMTFLQNHPSGVTCVFCLCVLHTCMYRWDLFKCVYIAAKNLFSYWPGKYSKCRNAQILVGTTLIYTLL